MVKYVLILSLFIVACAEREKKELSTENTIIPKPNSVEYEKGQFILNQKTILYSDIESREELYLLRDEIFELTGLNLSTNEKDMTESSIQLLFELDTTMRKEEYRLTVDDEMILILSSDREGMLHGIETLLQLIPNEKANEVMIQGVDVRDYPEFEHRGLLLDCSRHFWSVELVKKYIDLLRFYKMNTLHWHLTEDQGWRIEIKKYPRLTEVGAWRKEKDGSTYGGFYTQEQIKEIVDYAYIRGITIIPEIEMPGHSLAALAAYPTLACEEGPFEVTSEWGVFKEVYCAGNDSTFLFLENVLSEVIDLFPGEYIHIGGDESPKYRWEHCDKCQKRIKEEGLENEEELQSYFIRRIEKYLASKGKKLIGWDEILEGGLSATSAVQSWRGVKGGIEAAEHGNKVVMSPTSHCYLDYSLESINLEKIYNFQPIPENLAEEYHKNIIGAECNMWTEHVPTEEILDQKVLPRMIALAEVLWSKEEDFTDFRRRLKAHYPRLKSRGYNYGFEEVPVEVTVKESENKLRVTVQKSNEAFNIYYTTDGSEPDLESAVWVSDSFFEQSSTLKMKVVSGENTYPKLIEIPLSVHKALSKPYKVNLTFSDYYTAGGKTALTNGVLGTLDFRDGNWQGYQENDLEVVIDLEKSKEIKSVAAKFYQYQNSWIFAPEWVEFLVSENGVDYTILGKVKPQSTPKTNGKFIEEFKIESGTKGRYLKLKAKNINYCPEWHDAAGSPAWLFIDEIVVH